MPRVLVVEDDSQMVRALRDNLQARAEVSRWLGRRSVKITVDRYGHLTQDGQERCRQVVEAAAGLTLSGQPE